MRESRDGADVWHPQWAGEPGRRLYTAVHMPRGHRLRVGVLLVAPLFHELPRSRRLLSEIAHHLASLGFVSMQFDFYGMGDSMGLGEDTDFHSMRRDLCVVESALRERLREQAEGVCGVERLVVVAFRGGALPVMSWIGEGARPDLVVLWEPILDGLNWLQELEREDAAERRSPSRYSILRNRRISVPDAGDDAQLMGMNASRQLREDLAAFGMPAPVVRSQLAFWTVTRPHMRTLELEPESGLVLDADTPAFGGSTRMESALFMSPGLHRVVDALGQALCRWSTAVPAAHGGVAGGQGDG
ncbi:hypothetical protein [Marilutibacter chinensis]|uniref:Serine aminopeptidase S33 family n=1 Tax=Marilutibacter chinensis TaxID=2912247 RepID=A0ABS9HRK7_9GAMM|nr:hypothetical protein [Lysobacter chinensis]MCF7220947.1 hypothetical protein [Lysobacter chinensis]